MQKMKQKILVDVVNRQKERIPIRKVKSLVKNVLQYEGKMENISLVFVGDDEIKELNKRFLKKDKATDVLAFPFSSGIREEYYGEIVISTDTAKSQAKASFSSEIFLLVIHGLLHILGYRHSKEMRQKQDFYLERAK